MPEDEKQLSPALENYLAIIFRQEFAAGACRPSDIADAAGVARPSVTNALRELAKRGYVTYTPYSLVNLTEKGLRAGQELAHRNMVLKDFFQNVLQLSEDRAASVACELEHVIPEDVMLRWRQFVLYMHHTQSEWEHWQQKTEALREKHATKQHAASPKAPPAIVHRKEFVKD